MRTLLICTGVSLTAGTFVAAERLATATEQKATLEQQATIDAQKELTRSEFAAEIAALTAEKDDAQFQLASLAGSVETITADRDDLASQIVAEKSAADEIRDKLAELKASNLALSQELDASQASIADQNAELGALNARIETLRQEPTPDQAELVAEITSLNLALAKRDETIQSLQLQSEANAADDISGSAIASELRAAKTRLSEITETLRVRDATVSRLEAELDKASTSVALANPVAEAGDTSSEDVEALSLRLAELTELVDSQTKTISNLRMGFEHEPADAMEMASACIERANKIFEISQIKFATGTSSISAQSTATLDHLRDLAIGCESDDMFIEIGGHTDSLGSNAANQRLSEARAHSVRTFLIGRGIPEETMVAVGYGETRPIASNDTKVGRAQNRRITFTWQMRDEAPDAEAQPENVDG